jgi:hypothetical protein
MQDSVLYRLLISAVSTLEPPLSETHCINPRPSTYHLAFSSQPISSSQPASRQLHQPHQPR